MEYQPQNLLMCFEGRAGDLRWRAGRNDIEPTAQYAIVIPIKITKTKRISVRANPEERVLLEAAAAQAQINLIDPALFMFDFAVENLNQMNHFKKSAMKLKPCTIK